MTASLVIVVAATSAALILGAVWGLFGPLSRRAEGFVVALGGGALILSAAGELIRPAVESAGILRASLSLLAGGAAFTAVDYLIDEVWGEEGGAGLLAAITLDGVPENLALGVALIGAGLPEVASLAGAIVLSNLPEAAGGAKRMADSGLNRWRCLALWTATAALLAAAVVGGNLLLAGIAPQWLHLIGAFAAGAVMASLATEVFPDAYREDHHLAGIATIIGVIAALALGG